MDNFDWMFSFHSEAEKIESSKKKLTELRIEKNQTKKKNARPKQASLAMLS